MKSILKFLRRIFYKSKPLSEKSARQYSFDDDISSIEQQDDHAKLLYDDMLTEQYKLDMSSYLKHQPTAEQWDMILTPNAKVGVIAGAGAGKSTTLALRVVFLIKYLHVDISEIKIISFTNKSCEEMRDKLLDLFNTFTLEYTDEAIKGIVQTFHSLAFAQYSKISTYTKGYFEQIPANKTSDINEQLSKKNYARFKNIFGELYHTNIEFKKSIDKLRMITKLENNENELLENERIISRLQRHPISKLIKLELIKVELSLNVSTYAHGKLPDGRLLIVIEDKIKDYWKLISLIEAPFYVVEDINSDLEEFAYELKYSLKEHYPFQSLLIKNEIGSLVNIIEYVYGEIQYAESLNLSFEDLDINNFSSNEPFENYKITVIKSVWHKFYDYLSNEGLQTSNRIFNQLAKSINEDNISVEEILNMNHLMIDEFQDISPQLVSWIIACRRKIESKQDKTSFMCVGDDWQSIYGWRGSNPIFMTKFSNHFGKSKIITMNNNFRSTQNIIDSAELLMDNVKNKTLNRRGTASHPEYKNKSGSLEIHDFSLNTAKTIMNDLIHNYGYDKIFLISKITNDIKLFKNALGITKRFSGELTIHKSKGLEQEVVVILDSPSVPKMNFVRDYLFNLSITNNDPNNSYKILKNDEEYRLMYVAITRAKSKCIWFNLLPYKKYPKDKSVAGTPFNYIKNRLG